MKFKSSWFDGKKKTVVEVMHRGKKYQGIARVHPDDDGRASEYTGGFIAETRAMIAALKEERKALKEECEACRKFVRACTSYKNFDKDSPTAKAVFRQLNRKIKRVNELTDEINALYKSIDKGLWTRNLILNSIEAKKDKKD